MDRADQERVCELLREGASRALAAVEVGYLPAALNDAIAADPSFAKAAIAAEAACIGDVERVLTEKAKGGSLGAIKFLLTNRAPDRWRERTSVEHHGSVDVGVNVELTRTLVGVLERGGGQQVMEIVDAIEEAEFGEVAGELPRGD